MVSLYSNTILTMSNKWLPLLYTNCISRQKDTLNEAIFLQMEYLLLTLGSVYFLQRRYWGIASRFQMEESDPSEDQVILLLHPNNTWNHLKSSSGNALSFFKV